jgi:hypothetical protein
VPTNYNLQIVGLSPKTSDITGLLKAWRTGDRTALDELTALVYERLRNLAAFYLKKSRPPTHLARQRWCTKPGYGW